MLKILISFTFAFVANISSAQTFTVAGYQWAPYIDSNQENEGLSIALINEIFTRQGHEIKVIHEPWARSMNDLEKGKIDILPAVWFKEERLKIMNYSEAYLSNRLVFVKLKSNDFEYNSLEDIKGLSVGVIREYAYDGKILNYPDAQFAVTDSLKANLKKVISGRIDLTIEDQYTVMAQGDVKNLDKLDFAKNALDETPLYITCSKTNSKCEEIITIFNTGLLQMQESGELESFLESILK